MIIKYLQAKRNDTPELLKFDFVDNQLNLFYVKKEDIQQWQRLVSPSLEINAKNVCFFTSPLKEVWSYFLNVIEETKIISINSKEKHILIKEVFYG